VTAPSPVCNYKQDYKYNKQIHIGDNIKRFLGKGLRRFQGGKNQSDHVQPDVSYALPFSRV